MKLLRSSKSKTKLPEALSTVKLVKSGHQREEAFRVCLASSEANLLEASPKPANLLEASEKRTSRVK